MSEPKEQARAGESLEPSAEIWVVSYFDDPERHVIVHEKPLEAAGEKEIVLRIVVPLQTTAVIVVNAPIKHMFAKKKPVRWANDKEPPGLALEVLSPTQIRMSETNQTEMRGGELFHFEPSFLTLAADGTAAAAAGGDPTIFNEGIGKPPDDPDPGH